MWTSVAFESEIPRPQQGGPEAISHWSVDDLFYGSAELRTFAWTRTCAPSPRLRVAAMTLLVTASTGPSMHNHLAAVDVPVDEHGLGDV
jgi:hypothetical protein